jgi:hypothetical protein
MSICFDNGHFIDCEILHSIRIPDCSLVIDMNMAGFIIGVSGWMMVIGICAHSYYQSIQESRRLRYILPERRPINSEFSR